MEPERTPIRRPCRNQLRGSQHHHCWGSTAPFCCADTSPHGARWFPALMDSTLSFLLRDEPAGSLFLGFSHPCLLHNMCGYLRLQHWWRPPRPPLRAGRPPPSPAAAGNPPRGPVHSRPRPCATTTAGLGRLPATASRPAAGRASRSVCRGHLTFTWFFADRVPPTPSCYAVGRPLYSPHPQLQPRPDAYSPL